MGRRLGYWSLPGGIPGVPWSVWPHRFGGVWSCFGSCFGRWQVVSHSFAGWCPVYQSTFAVCSVLVNFGPVPVLPRTVSQLCGGRCPSAVHVSFWSASLFLVSGLVPRSLCRLCPTMCLSSVSVVLLSVSWSCLDRSRCPRRSPDRCAIVSQVPVCCLGCLQALPVGVHPFLRFTPILSVYGTAGH